MLFAGGWSLLLLALFLWLSDLHQPAEGANAPGREIEGPMALVILGGLFTSTALNLFILPPLALRYGRFSGAQANELFDAADSTRSATEQSPVTVLTPSE